MKPYTSSYIVMALAILASVCLVSASKRYAYTRSRGLREIDDFGKETLIQPELPELAARGRALTMGDLPIEDSFDVDADLEVAGSSPSEVSLPSQIGQLGSRQRRNSIPTIQGQAQGISVAIPPASGQQSQVSAALDKVGANLGGVSARNLVRLEPSGQEVQQSVGAAPSPPNVKPPGLIATNSARGMKTQARSVSSARKMRKFQGSRSLGSRARGMKSRRRSSARRLATKARGLRGFRARGMRGLRARRLSRINSSRGIAGGSSDGGYQIPDQGPGEEQQTIVYGPSAGLGTNPYLPFLRSQLETIARLAYDALGVFAHINAPSYVELPAAGYYNQPEVYYTN